MKISNFTLGQLAGISGAYGAVLLALDDTIPAILCVVLTLVFIFLPKNKEIY